MKMVSEKKEEGGKLSSWKVYYSVLSNGFLLLYKDTKNKVYRDTNQQHTDLHRMSRGHPGYPWAVLTWIRVILIQQESRIQKENMSLLFQLHTK